MIQNGTILKIVDNTGITSVRCFKPHNIKRLGDVVSCSVVSIAKTKNTNNKINFKRGDVVHALIINTVSSSNSGFINNGIGTSFSFNSGIIMENSSKDGWLPVGSRIYATVPRCLRQKGWANIITLAEFVILLVYKVNIN